MYLGIGTVSNVTLADATLGAPPKDKSAFTKAAYLPTRQQSENTDPRILDLFFDAAPILSIVYQIFELRTQAADANYLRVEVILPNNCEDLFSDKPQKHQKKRIRSPQTPILIVFLTLCAKSRSTAVAAPTTNFVGSFRQCAPNRTPQQ